MNDLQRSPRQMPGYPAAPYPGAPDVIEMPGPGPREHAGLIEYWHMVLRNKGTIALVAAAGALVAFLLTLGSPRLYQARTTIEIQGVNSDFLNMGSVTPTRADSGYDTVADLQTHVRIMQSRTILERVAEQLQKQQRPADLQPPDRLGMWRRALDIDPPSQDDLYAQALGMAQGGVSVRATGTNRIVEVTCQSTSGQVAADFCNTLAQQYIDQNLESRWQSTEYTGQWLTKQLHELKIKLEQSQDELQAFVRQTGLVVSNAAAEGETANAQEVRLSDLLKELSAAQADRIAKQSRYEMAMAGSPTGLPDVLDDEAERASRRQLLDLQTKLAQLLVTFTPNHPEVRRTQAQIALIESSLQSSRGDIVNRLRTEFEAAERREALLVNEYAQQARLVSSQAEQTARYNLLKREVDAGRMLYDNLLQRTKEASVASALRATNIRVVDPARPSSSPFSPNVSRQASIGLLIGLVLGVGLAFVRERADRTLQDPGEVAHYLGVPELGVIPVGEPIGDRRRLPGAQLLAGNGRDGSGDTERVEMVAWSERSSLLAESFRTTLTSILFSRRNGQRPQLLVFTSAGPKEGKTTIVCNIGIALAEINHRVLLIDGDMRRPRVHRVFGLDNGHGLSDLLLQKTALDADDLKVAIRPTRVPGVFVLTSGGLRRSASSLLHSARLPELLALARAQFDTVIVDTPPMVNLADARVVGRFADGLIMVVRSGQTTRDAALMAADRLAEDGIPILGTILNFWNPKTPGSSQYKYYYSGYYHYYGGGDDDAGGETDGASDTRIAPRAARRIELSPELHRSAEVGES